MAISSVTIERAGTNSTAIRVTSLSVQVGRSSAHGSGTFLEVLNNMAEGPTRTTVLLVTHDQRVIDHADRIVNMVGGKIVTNSLTRIAVRICRALAQLEALKGLSESTLSRIASHMTVETRQPGETIVREGEEGDTFSLSI
jgi:putative ABC transport system ATP-binding protein